VAEATHSLRSQEARPPTRGRWATLAPAWMRRRQRSATGVPAAPGADPDDLLHQAELDGERIAALFRCIIFASLLAAVAFTDPGLHQTDIASSLSLYGVGTLIGIGLAWRKIFHPVIPYLFVTFDIGMVSIQLLLLTETMGMPPAQSLATPVATLVFVIMVHASMRYRPWLVVYAAGLFVLAIQIGGLLIPAGGQFPEQAMGMQGMGMQQMGMQQMPMGMQQQGAMGQFVLLQAFPVAVIGLSALILFVTGRRTQNLLLESISQTYRADKLSRYFSPNLAERLAASPDERLLAGSRQRAAVLFVDIRGFTTMAEAMDPTELGAFLSEFRRRLSASIFSHDGTVDKFIGDAIMAVFGTPVAHVDDARRAIACAVEMLDATTAWSRERQQAGLSPIGIGIGGHFGEVFAGALGDQRLLEYTVIGDTVNVAERLEKLTREVPSSLIVSSALLAAGGESAAEQRWQSLAGQRLKGHGGPVDAFALVSEAEGDIPAQPAPDREVEDDGGVGAHSDRRR
jgi:adenylate cyclase